MGIALGLTSGPAKAFKIKGSTVDTFEELENDWESVLGVSVDSEE